MKDLSKKISNRWGASMNKILEKLSPALKKKLRKTAMPTFEKPMLATLTNNYFSDEHWLFERKFDGARILVFKDHDTVFLKSRNNTLRSSTYPEVVAAAQRFPVAQVILDGEIVTFEGKETSFEKLQLRIGVTHPSAALIKKVKIYLYVFDILYLDGYDLTALPLITRKEILHKSISFKGPLRYVEHRDTQGLKFFKQSCKSGWEGLIAKRRDSTYVHERSSNWLKFKCIQGQEMVIGGYTAPQGSRTGFGSLLLGYFDKHGELHYAGRVGTGFSESFLASFIQRLKKIEIKKNPFSNKSAVDMENVHFVQPVLVAEIGFEQWTKGNKLRQPRFQGIRDDKNAKDVVKETPQSIVPES